MSIRAGHMRGSQGAGGLDPHGESQVVIGFLRNIGTPVRTTLEEQLDPSGPIASRGRFELPSVKYVDKKSAIPTPTPKQLTCANRRNTPWNKDIAIPAHKSKNTDCKATYSLVRFCHIKSCSE